MVERVSQAMVGLVAGGKRCVWLVHGAAVGDCGGVGGMRLVGREKDTLYVSGGDGGGVWLMERGLVAVVERGWRGIGSCGIVSSCGRM